jgi:negative regulator of genetic competence, sporulation and motility
VEVLKISDSKLKIMLTGQDMQRYRLNSDNIDYNDPKTKHSFWQILDSVKETHGFDTSGDKVLIQFYPSKDGGCELFITKLGILPAASERTIAKSNRITMLEERRCVYRFDDFETMLSGVKLIKSSDGIKYSDAFLGEGGEYYLEIFERGAVSAAELCELSRLLEFARSVPLSRYPYITEHCEKLTDGDAVDLLSKL